METVSHVPKDAMDVQDQLINVLLVNQDSSLLDPNVKLLVNLTSTEMEQTDAENVQILARPALMPLPVLHVLSQEINQSTVSAILAFIHAPPVLHMNNVPDVFQDSILLMEDVPANAHQDHQLSMEFVNVSMEFSTTVNVLSLAQSDLLTLMELAKNAQITVMNAQEKPPHVPHVNQDSC